MQKLNIINIGTIIVVDTSYIVIPASRIFNALTNLLFK
jgi:hypothetical protein